MALPCLYTAGIMLKDTLAEDVGEHLEGLNT